MWDGAKAELRGKFIPLNLKMRNVSSQHRTPVKHLKMKNRRVILTGAEEHLTKFNTVYDKSDQARDSQEASRPDKGHLQNTYSKPPN